jgi:hypothetical protein
MRQGLLFLLLLLATACQPSYDEEAIVKQLMDETLQQRIDNYKKVRRERCWDGLIREANRLADSILFVEAKMAKDTITRPPIPIRPTAPEKKILEDTTPVKPFLPDTIQ